MLMIVVRHEEDVKRRRTASGSSSPHSKHLRPEYGSEGDDAQSAGKHKLVRGANARNHRGKELREREAKEKERPESRKGRNQYTKRKFDGQYFPSDVW